MAVLETGAHWSTTLPASQRMYYEALLLDTIRSQSILTPFCAVKEDFAARETGQILYTEVLDTDPNWNAVTENVIYLNGSHLDSRSITIGLNIYGGVIKLSDFAALQNYWNSGDMRGLIRGKLGQQVVDEMDYLARAAFLTHPYPMYAGSATSRITLGATDYFLPDMAENVYTALQEADVPGVMDPADGQGETVVCVTSPRVIHDIRTGAAGTWLTVQNYAQTGRKFNQEVGMWGNVRFVKSNRLRLRNFGALIQQTTLNGATVEGQGGYGSVVDTVYTVGQSTATHYVTVTSATGFAVGDYVTIHDVTKNGGAGNPPIESDGTLEVRRIVNIAGAQISFDKPLMKAHNTGDLFTKGRDLHSSLFLGGPAVVLGIGERPNVMVLPKIDDLQMVNRFSWRAFMKYQMFRPEFMRVVYSAGT